MYILIHPPLSNILIGIGSAIGLVAYVLLAVWVANRLTR